MLWRAVVFALPAGAVIWLIANIHIGGLSIAEHLVHWLNPLGVVLGLNGVILLAYVVAIPANEIVIPTILMLTVLVTGQAGLGRGAGIIQLAHKDDTAMPLYIAGWSAAKLKEAVCRSTIAGLRREAHKPGSVFWFKGGKACPTILACSRDVPEGEATGDEWRTRTERAPWGELLGLLRGMTEDEAREAMLRA